jgi:5'(3')-deoxyribonucleotidase
MTDKKPIIYFDMDGTVVNFQSGIDRLSDKDKVEFDGRFDEHPLIFSLMDPVDGAIEAVETLRHHFDIYVLTTSPWNNPNAASQKLAWIKKYFGDGPDSAFYKRVTMSHHKRLHHGDYLIDDREIAAAGFAGRHIHFNSGEFTSWHKVVEYLLGKHPVTEQ